MAFAVLMPSSLAQTLPPDEEVRQILRQRIDVEKRGVGLVVGLIDAHDRRVVPYGTTAREGGQEIDGRTIFEIGSVTKVFTTLLLADFVQHSAGSYGLDSPAFMCMPSELKTPDYRGREPTLLDLATHRSGLPSVPDNMKPADPANPWADYTTRQVLDFLSKCELKREPGSRFEYSNFGMGWLGWMLGLFHPGTESDYEKVVIERICRPLNLPDTRITLSANMQSRMALPYDESLRPAKNWDIPTLAGAGALRSDADDLLTFVAANLGLIKSPLADAMKETQKVRNTTDQPDMDIGLGWFILKRHDPPVWWHNGGTGGYRSFVGFCPARKTGVVVLSNTANSVDDIGLHLLDARFPLEKLTPPAPPRAAITLAPEIADRYVGRYALTPTFVITFSREGERYFVQATGQSRLETFAASETEFFLKAVEARVSFVEGKDGKFRTLILHQNGLDQPGQRLP